MGGISQGRTQGPPLERSPLSSWRLIESPPSDIFSQMALDRELFEVLTQDQEALPLLRIYQVSEPAMTVGRSYRKGSPPSFPSPQGGGGIGGEKICIRPTGGGLVRHGNDLLYSVIARRHTHPTFNLVRTSYLSFHEALQEAFETLGFSTRLFRCDEAKKRNRSLPFRFGPPDCFSNPIATDLLLEEQKIAGGAQWRRGGAFLHQGSVQMPRGVSFESLKEAFLEALERKFEPTWMRESPSSMRNQF